MHTHAFRGSLDASKTFFEQRDANLDLPEFKIWYFWFLDRICLYKWHHQMPFFTVRFSPFLTQRTHDLNLSYIGGKYDV